MSIFCGTGNNKDNIFNELVTLGALDSNFKLKNKELFDSKVKEYTTIVSNYFKSKKINKEVLQLLAIDTDNKIRIIDNEVFELLDKSISDDNTLKDINFSSKTVDKLKLLLLNKISNIDKLITKLEKEADKSKAERLKSLQLELKELQEKLDDNDILSGVMIFIKDINKQVDITTNNLQKDIDSGDLMEKISFYDTVLQVEPIIKELSDSVNEKFIRNHEINKLLNNLQNNLSTISKNISNVKRDKSSEWLTSLNTNKELSDDDITNLLDESIDKTSIFSRWLSTARNSKDEIVSLLVKGVHKALFNARKEAQATNDSFIKSTQKFIDHMKSKGIKDSNFDVLYSRFLDDTKTHFIKRFDKKQLDAIKSFKQGNKNKINVFTDEEALNAFYKRYPKNKTKGITYEQIVEKLDIKSKYDLLDNEEKEYYHKIIEQRKIDVSKLSMYVDIYKLPTVSKSLSEVVTNKGLFSSDTWDYVKNDFKIGEFDYNYSNTDINGNKVRSLPVFFNGNVIEENKNQLSLNIPNNIMLFSTMASEHKGLASIENQVLATEEFLKTRNIIATKKGVPIVSNFTKFLINKFGTQKQKDEAKDNFETIKGVESNTYEQAKDFIDQIFYKQGSDRSTLFGKDITKTIDKVNEYTAIAKLSGNIFQAGSTLITGALWTKVEAVGKGVFSSENLSKARKMYLGTDGFMINILNSNVPDYVKDSFKNSPESKINLLRKYFQIDTKQEFKSDIMQIVDPLNLGFLNNAAEHMTSSILLLSVMDNTFVTNDKGEKLSLNEAIELTEDGKLQLKEGYQLDDNIAFEVNRKVIELNSQISGVQTADDKIAIKKFALGRAIMLFRNWVEPAYTRRFNFQYDTEGNMKPVYNQSTQTQDFGYYAFTANWLFNSVKQNKLDALIKFKALYDNLNTEEKLRVKKFLTEQLMIVSFFILAKALEYINPDDDEEKYMVVSSLNIMSNRVMDEMGQFTLPWKTLDLLQTPAAGISMFETVFDAMNSIAGFELNLKDSEEELIDFNINNQYESGKRKGQYKVLTPFINLTPFGTVERLYNVNEDNRLN